MRRSALLLFGVTPMHLFSKYRQGRWNTGHLATLFPNDFTEEN